MAAVAEVAEPGTEGGRVVPVDEGAVRHDGGGAGDGGPLANGVDEGDVYVGVLGELVDFVGVGVCEEEKVGAV